MTNARSREDAFRAVFDANFTSILGFALRRTASAQDGADVAAETMLVAWRRFDDLPAGDEARLWLYGVARRLLANHHRGQERRERLGAKFRERFTQAVVEDPIERMDLNSGVQRALAALSDADRELVTLNVWEDLEPREIAAVLGLDPQVVRTRLHRARGRLRVLLTAGDAGVGAGHVVDDGRPPVREEEQR